MLTLCVPLASVVHTSCVPLRASNPGKLSPEPSYTRTERVQLYSNNTRINCFSERLLSHRHSFVHTYEWTLFVHTPLRLLPHRPSFVHTQWFTPPPCKLFSHSLTTTLFRSCADYGDGD